MSEPRRCPSCGAEIPVDDPDGTSRQCLVSVGTGKADFDVTAKPGRVCASLLDWVRRHRQPLVSSFATAAVLGLVVFGMAMASRVRRLDAERTARLEVNRFREKSEEAFFFASGSDAMDETFRDFDLPSGAESVRVALVTARKWGDNLQKLPLIEREREDVRRELYEVLLLAAQIEIRRSNDSHAMSTAQAHLEEARRHSEPTRAFYRLQSQCLRALGKSAEAAVSDRVAEDPETVSTPLDHFFRGEEYRAAVGQVAAGVGDGHVRRRGNFDLAIAEYRAALQLDPDHYWSLLQLARCLLHSGDSRQAHEAIGVLTACIALQPESPRGFSARGAALAVRGRYADALRDFDRALAIDANYQSARLHRGWVYWQQGEHAWAVSDFQDVWAAPEDIRMFQAAYYLGQLYLHQGDYDRATDYLSQYVALDRSLSQAFRDLACSEYLRGQEATGRQHLNMFVELSAATEFDPDSREAHLERGRFLCELASLPSTPGPARNRLHRAALQEFEQIDNMDRTTEYFYNAGIAFQATGDVTRAVEVFSLGLERDSGNLGLLSRRGRGYFRLGDFDQAERDYRQVVNSETAADEASVLFPEAHAVLGCIRAAQPDARAAGTDVIRALLALQGVDPASEHEFPVWHDMACVFGKLAQDKLHGEEYQDLAIAFLQNAVDLARDAGKPAYALEVQRIESEESFDKRLRGRTEIQELLAEVVEVLPVE